MKLNLYFIQIESNSYEFQKFEFDLNIEMNEFKWKIWNGTMHLAQGGGAGRIQATRRRWGVEDVG
jgi:hypothetical protein